MKCTIHRQGEHFDAPSYPVQVHFHGAWQMECVLPFVACDLLAVKAMLQRIHSNQYMPYHRMQMRDFCKEVMSRKGKPARALSGKRILA